MDGKRKKRIRTGKLRQEDLAARLAELAFGPANDCVKLVLDPSPQVDKLELSHLCELRRSDKGAVEIKLVDRLQALTQLLSLVGTENTGLEDFLTALQGGTECTFPKNSEPC